MNSLFFKYQVDITCVVQRRFWSSAQPIFTWLYVLIVSRTHFRVNVHSIVCLIVKELLAWSRRHIWSLRQVTARRSESRCSHWSLPIECIFTLKLTHDMIITYNQMHRTDKYSQHSSIIWPVWLNGWVFVYELSGCGFKSSCSHLTFTCSKSTKERPEQCMKLVKC